jgi:hypothetical protein
MKPELIQLLVNLGNNLKFAARTEVGASESAFVDVVWFDTRLPIPVDTRSFNMRYQPFLPIVSFEVELHTGLNAKHVKGSVSNLNNLGAQLGVIVIGKDNLTTMGNRAPYLGDSPEKLKPILRDRVYRWVYAEAQPKSRIVVMFEDEVRKWSEGMLNKQLSAAQGTHEKEPETPPVEVESLS